MLYTLVMPDLIIVALLLIAFIIICSYLFYSLAQNMITISNTNFERTLAELHLRVESTQQQLIELKSDLQALKDYHYGNNPSYREHVLTNKRKINQNKSK